MEASTVPKDFSTCGDHGGFRSWRACLCMSCKGKGCGEEMKPSNFEVWHHSCIARHSQESVQDGVSHSRRAQ